MEAFEEQPPTSIGLTSTGVWIFFPSLCFSFSQTRRFLCIAAFDAHSHPHAPSALPGSSPSLSLIHSAPNAITGASIFFVAFLFSFNRTRCFCPLSVRITLYCIRIPPCCRRTVLPPCRGRKQRKEGGRCVRIVQYDGPSGPGWQLQRCRSPAQQRQLREQANRKTEWHLPSHIFRDTAWSPRGGGSASGP